MTQAERRLYLIQYLLWERGEDSQMEVPADAWAQKALLRALFNVRMPAEASREFLAVQDAYLQEEIRQKGITRVSDMEAVQDGIYLWRGDITTLACDAIVNAANSGMLGCFCPNHGCIDNAIHTFAGLQLRLVCAKIMKRQGHEEETGRAKITPSFNLPCSYVIHTVGPIVRDQPTAKEKELLASCYRACLEAAEEKGLSNIAFCCISTGEFHFPNDLAAEIAVQAVKDYRAGNHCKMEVIFNVFKEKDYNIYRRLLRAD